MDDSATPLLVAERDDAKRTFLVDQLLADGFAAHGARCSEEARVKLASFHAEVLVLGGLERSHAHLALLRELRSRGLHDLLVVVFGAADSEPAELRAFEAGGDDYLRTPVSYPVLLARVRALVRRSRGAPVPRRRIGALEIDAPSRAVTVAECPLALSRMEFELLSRLAAEPTRVWTKEELLREVWGYRSLGRTRTLDAHACRLRRKLALAGAPHLIVNTRGVGYRLAVGQVVAEPAEIDADTSAVPAARDRHAA